MINNELMVGDYVLKLEQGGHYKKAIITAIFTDNISCITYDNIGIEHTLSFNAIEPIPITVEILYKNCFKYDSFTNLSPDFYYEDKSIFICINLNSTFEKNKSIFVTNKNLKITASIEESRQALQEKPLFIHELQHVLRICKIEKEIIL